MTKIKSIFLLLLVLFSFTNPVFAKRETGFRFFSFRLGGIGVLQSGGDGFSGIVTYNPAFKFSEVFGIRLNLGGTMLKDKIGTLQPVLEYTILASIQWSPSMVAELGGGQQNFISNGGTRNVLSANLIYTWEKNFLLLFDHLFVGYTAALIPTLFTHEVRAGLGINF